jgi:hypothetical protein
MGGRKQITSVGRADVSSVSAAGKAPVATAARSPARRTPFPFAAVTVVSAYIAAQMLADVASLKIGIVAGLAVDMGTFIYPITFTLRDMAHKVIGRSATRRLIVLAALINLFMAGYLWLCTLAPSDPVGGRGDAFRALFALDGRLLRIVLASIVAEIVSQMANTEVFQWFATRVSRRHQWARTLLSNSVAVPLDSVVFGIGAFGGNAPWRTVGEIIVFNIAVKMAVTVLSIPLVYTVPDPENF